MVMSEWFWSVYWSLTPLSFSKNLGFFPFSHHLYRYITIIIIFMIIITNHHHQPSSSSFWIMRVSHHPGIPLPDHIEAALLHLRHRCLQSALYICTSLLFTILHIILFTIMYILLHLGHWCLCAFWVVCTNTTTLQHRIAIIHTHYYTYTLLWPHCTYCCI